MQKIHEKIMFMAFKLLIANQRTIIESLPIVSSLKEKIHENCERMEKILDGMLKE